MIPNIRPITEEEKPLAEALYRNTFKIDTETSQRWLRLTDLADTRAIVEDGRVASMLVILPMTVWVGGRQMSMGGISGVATWADQQGKGYAGHLVRSAIADMRQRGESISILYPFSFPFYERFGYELVNHYTTYQASPADFALPATNAEVQVRAAILPGDMPLIQETYRRIAPRWNTMLDRDKSPWNTDHEHNGSRWGRWLEHMSADRKQVYLLETSEEKQVVGFFSVFDNALPEGGYESTVSELMLEHDEHMDVLARFCRRLPANVKKVKLIAAPGPLLWRLFKEPRVTTELHACYQARVVDVEKACSERGYASGVEAEVLFAISDGCASAWNSGPWHLRVRDGRGEINRYSGPQLDMLHLSIQHFSAIFTGYKRATEYVTTYPGHAAELKIMDELFHDRPTRLLDFF